MAQIARKGSLRTDRSGWGAVVLVMLAALSSAILLGPAVGAARADTWTRISPDGGAVTSLAVDPSDPATAYAVMQSGLYKTVDAGAHWSHRDTAGVFATKVAIDPTAPSTIYVAGGGGVAKSTDGGTTFQGGLTDQAVAVGFFDAADLVIDPQVTSTIYAAGLTGVFKSVDGGSTWEPSSSGLRPKAATTGLAIDPSRPATLYAATSVGVFKSSDAGATWQPSRTGMGTARVVAMAIDPAAPGRIYAATGLYVPGEPRAHGLYVSTDGGDTWASRPLVADDPYVLCLAVPPAAQGTVYACTSDGLLRSLDGGAAWTRIDRDGMPQMGSLAIASSLPRRLYAGALQPGNNGQAVYRTSSMGALWEPSGHGLPAPTVSFVVDPSFAGTLYLSTYGSLWKTLDYGNTWMPAVSGLEGSTGDALAICAAAPASLFTVSENKITRFPALFATHSAAARWFPVATPFIVTGPLVVDPRDPEVIYAVGEARNGSQLWKTADGGASWEQLRAGKFGNVRPSLAVAPSSPSTIYVIQNSIPGDSSLLASHNAGTSFEVVGTFRLPTGGLVVDPTEASTIYLLDVPTAPMLKSTDGGRTFAALAVPGGTVFALAIDPAQPSLLYAGTYGEVDISHDGGQTWTDRLGGLPDVSIVGLALAPGGDLYALVDEALYHIHP